MSLKEAVSAETEAGGFGCEPCVPGVGLRKGDRRQVAPRTNTAVGTAGTPASTLWPTFLRCAHTVSGSGACRPNIQCFGKLVILNARD